MPAIAKQIEPVSVTQQTAANALDMHYETFRDLVTRGVFTAIRPDGKGRGKRVFVMWDEVKVYGETRSEDDVRDLRFKKKRLGM